MAQAAQDTLDNILAEVRGRYTTRRFDHRPPEVEVLVEASLVLWAIVPGHKKLTIPFFCVERQLAARFLGLPHRGQLRQEDYHAAALGVRLWSLAQWMRGLCMRHQVTCPASRGYDCRTKPIAAFVCGTKSCAAAAFVCGTKSLAVPLARLVSSPRIVDTSTTGFETSWCGIATYGRFHWSGRYACPPPPPRDTVMWADLTCGPWLVWCLQWVQDVLAGLASTTRANSNSNRGSQVSVRATLA
jgi:hypothetical protein